MAAGAAPQLQVSVHRRIGDGCSPGRPAVSSWSGLGAEPVSGCAATRPGPHGAMVHEGGLSDASKQQCWSEHVACEANSDDKGRGRFCITADTTRHDTSADTLRADEEHIAGRADGPPAHTGATSRLHWCRDLAVQSGGCGLSSEDTLRLNDKTGGDVPVTVVEQATIENFPCLVDEDPYATPGRRECPCCRTRNRHDVLLTSSF